MAKLTVPEVPPVVNTDTLADAETALAAMTKVAVICVALTMFTLVTVTDVLFTSTSAPGPKLVPVSVTGTLVPGVPLFGLIEVRVGGASNWPL
jgi:hypothetical protein